MLLDLFEQLNLESLFTPSAAYVVLSLVVIEGLLSVDNALAIAAMAAHLDEKRRNIAMTVGYAGAYGFRLLALLVAGFIIHNPLLMVLGAAYLIWLMCDHFDEEEENIEHPGMPSTHTHNFAKTITMIAILDLSLSLDNVVAAVAFARDSILLVYLGVTIGIITLRLVAGYCIKLLQRYPWLEHTAFILVGFVGMLLLTELFWDKYVRTEVTLPLIGISVIEREVAVDLGNAADTEHKVHYHIQKFAKFGGLLAIILGHLAYENISGAKPIFGPFFKLIQHLLALVSRLIAYIFRCVTFPIRFIFNRARQGSH